jgi:DNA-binding response OmpR family regulator
VLLVEDEPLLLKSTERLLAMRGFGVLSALDAVSAMLLADRAARLALLVTDISLPGIDGVELALRLRKDRLRLPVLFVSGSEQHQGRITLPENGSWTFLPKPFNGRQLDERLRELLGAAAGAMPSRPR